MQSVFAGNFPASHEREEKNCDESETKSIKDATLSTDLHCPLTNLERQRNQERQQKRMHQHVLDFAAEARYIVCMVVLLVSILLLQRAIAFLFRYYMKMYKGFDDRQIAWWQLVLSIFLITLVVIFAILWHDRETDATQ